MDPVTRAITLDRSLPPRPMLEHWQATPLTLTGTMDDGEDLDWADTLTGELLVSQEDNTSLAAVTVTIGDGEGPYDFEFTAAQMNQSIPSGRKKKTFWLQITATVTSGRREVLYAAGLTLHRTAYSGEIPDPPEVALYATAAALSALTDRVDDLEGAITEGTGYATITIGGVTINVPVITP